MPPFFVVFLVVFLADFFFAMASSTSFHESMYVLQKFASTFFCTRAENLLDRANARSRARNAQIALRGDREERRER
jgi:hypothetical protein